jgi:hypothetical protein
MNDQADDEAVDLDQVLGDDEVDAELDSSWSPPERPRELDAYGTTVAEQRAGETLDQRLAQEEPDPALAADLGADDGEVLDDGQVGSARSGRLLASDQGAGADDEERMIATDVGIDGGAATAEEAAMHVVPEESAADEGSSV